MRLLVNFVFAPPVGHAIEALHYAFGYHRANPDLQIDLACHADTPYELADLCPYIQNVYPIAVDFFDPQYDAADALAQLPREFDWVVDDNRGHVDGLRQFFPGLANYYDSCADYFRVSNSFGFAGAAPPAYSGGTGFRLEMPAAKRQQARERLGSGGPRIAVLPGGSAPRANYPSVRSWSMILRALQDRYPGATFCFVGKLAADGRTSTSFDRAEFDEVRAEVKRSVEAVDIPLIDQLSVVAECDVLISPHSGFGMAALAVGAPWLTISGNKWPEFYFPGTPFYSVLPDLARFPCYTGIDPEPAMVEDDGPRSPSMSRERIAADLPEIIAGAAKLIDGDWDLPAALEEHTERLMRMYGDDRSRIYSIDNVLGK
ncbi:MAG TPA: hypothetical protein VHC49_20260 [Mycobacteriales bacterium]|nr:hypothetical protein [Mycobacteriales bacterium]